MKIYRSNFKAIIPAFIVAALMLATIGLTVGTIPNLVGNWTGPSQGYQNGQGFLNTSESGIITMMISEQNGRVFNGTFIINATAEHKVISPMNEGFSGVIASDNKTFYLAENERGYDIGNLISNDKAEVYYIEGGNNAAAFIMSLTRVPNKNAP